MDRLLQLGFNPFQDFKMQIENSNIQTNFSLLHLNIRSIANKFDLFKKID